MLFVIRFIRRLLLLFFSSTLLAVVAYRFVPVLVTPLMLIRACQNLSNGQSPLWHHSWAPLSEISPHMPVAVMASEDQRFLDHRGFDFEQIEKAARQNKRGGRRLGASTITQQTAKNVFLWPGRTWLRKGLEAYFTLLIELLWSKQRIMEVYLNVIEMGPSLYGVQAVARAHFDRSASKLQRSDCALIAATLPAPLRYSSKNPSRYVLKRQTQIEQQMRHIRPLPKEGEDR